MHKELEMEYLSSLINVRTLSLVKPKPRKLSVQTGVKTQTPTVRAPPSSIKESGGNSQRPSLANSFRGRASLCRRGSNNNGREGNTLCASRPPESPCPPSPPICSPKSVRKPRRKMQMAVLFVSKLDHHKEKLVL
jgi:hypothetical protein